MPKVSVVIPTYNRAHFLAESLQSVIAQTFTDYEVVIIDDGSSDNTREVVNSFSDRRIRYAYQENQGVAVAGNLGFELSRGEYIAFFSSDDILLEDALEKGVKVLDDHPEVAFSYGQTYQMDDKGQVLGLKRLKGRVAGVREGIAEIRDLIFENHIPAKTVMARRNCLFEVGLFDTAFRYGSEDIELFIRLAKRYHVAYIAEPMVKSRKHSGTTSVGRKMDEEENTKRRILETVFDDAELGPVLSPLKPKAYFHLHLRLARRAYGKGDMKNVRQHLYKALKADPRGFCTGLWTAWIYQFARTWVPGPVLRSLRKTKAFLHVIR